MADETVIDTLFAVGPVAAATVDTVTEYAALSPWNDVGNTVDLGEFANSFAAVTADMIAGNIKKGKGALDNGNVSIKVVFDPADTGQTAMRTAWADRKKDYGFRFTLEDAITSLPTIIYFRGKVMTKTRTFGTVNNFVYETYTIAVVAEPVIRAAS